MTTVIMNGSTLKILNDDDGGKHPIFMEKQSNEEK